MVIDRLARALSTRSLGHPLRVGVSGITGCGKSTFGDSLADALRALGRPVVRCSIDDFHNPRAIRYRQGRGSAQGYYEDAHDYAALRDRLLGPLAGPEPFLHRRRSWDLASDLPYDDPPAPAAAEAIFVVDGTFLFKDCLRDHWDFRIFLRTSFDVAKARGASRDALLLGGLEKARALYESRYHRACQRYLIECEPEARADVIVPNDGPGESAG